MAKRKRAARKPVSRKPSAVGKKNEETTQKQVPKGSSAVDQNEEAFLNFVNQNNKENSRCEDSNDFEVVNNQSDSGSGSGSGSDFPSEAGSSSSSSSFSSESNDEAYSGDDGSSDNLSIDKRSRKSVKGHVKAKQKARKLSIKEGKEKHKSSRVLRSSIIKQKEFETPHQDLRYNKQELKAALGVIKKVMKMDEAQPFNVPVDPVALGKPDYFNIIDTPMDFSTICSNLRNNVKYMNSEDVLKDVKYIWENCFKYNKKGEYVVYLVKRVKKKFMKYWIAAGLYNEQSRKPNGNFNLQPPADHAMRHNGYEPMHQAGNAMVGISHMQQNRLESNLLHRQLPPLSHSQPYQSQPLLPPSTMWPHFSQFPPSSSGQSPQPQHPQPSSNQSQYSQSQHRAECSSAGRSHFQPSPDKVRKHKNHRPSSSLGPTGPHNQSQPVLPQVSHNLPLVMQQPQQSTSHLQASQFPGAVDTRHSNMPPPTDYPRNTGYVPWGAVDPMVASPIEVNPLGNARSNEPQQPQASHGQHQSWFQAHTDIEHSLADSAMRGIRCALNYSAGPIMNNQGQEDQLRRGTRQPEQMQLNQNQGEQSQQPPKKMKKGRGPTRCLFLNDLPDGERIVVPINKLGQPIGPQSSKLTSFLGTIARNGHMAPLTYVQWRHMPDSCKEQMWQHVQTKFDIDPGCKSWVMKSLATKWRDWKAELKAKHYYPHRTDEERLKDCHPRIVPDQWQFLVSYWNSDDAKKLCATNRANRSKQKATHASGPKSFARVREEERMKRPDGKEPTRAELYILTHTRKDGQPVDETAAANIAKLRELVAKKQNDEECSDDDNDTFCQVMGEERRGYVRTYGLGPTRDDIYGPRPNRDLIKIAAEVKKSASEEVSKVLVKMEAMEQKYANMENQIARLTSSMQMFLEKFGGPSNILGSELVLNTPNSPQHLNHPHLHSTSSSHAGANGRGYA